MDRDMKRKTTVVMAALMAVTCMAYAMDVYEKYFDELVIGQKWRYEVTDIESQSTAVAEVVLGKDSVLVYRDKNNNSYNCHGYAVTVSFDNSITEKYFITDFIQEGECPLEVYSVRTNSFLTVMNCDNREGDYCKVMSEVNNRIASDVDYIFAAEKARKRIRLTNPDDEADISYYVCGVGLNEFETRNEAGIINRKYRLIQTELPDGCVFSCQDFYLPVLEPENKYYKNGTVLKYVAWEHMGTYFNVEWRVVGDTVSCHMPCKKMECWSDFGGEYKKEFEFELFDIDDVVYRNKSPFYSSFRVHVPYNMEIGDRVSDVEMYGDFTEVVDVFEKEIDGETRRIFKFKDAESMGLEGDGLFAICGYWIEGVGPGNLETLCGSSWWMTRLEGMYRDGECLFRYASLFEDVGLENLPEEEYVGEPDLGGSTLYNLQGIPIDCPVPGQPYIKSGRLVMQ